MAFIMHNCSDKHIYTTTKDIESSDEVWKTIDITNFIFSDPSSNPTFLLQSSSWLKTYSALGQCDNVHILTCNLSEWSKKSETSKFQVYALNPVITTTWTLKMLLSMFKSWWKSCSEKAFLGDSMLHTIISLLNRRKTCYYHHLVQSALSYTAKNTFSSIVRSTSTHLRYHYLIIHYTLILKYDWLEQQFDFIGKSCSTLQITITKWTNTWLEVEMKSLADHMYSSFILGLHDYAIVKYRCPIKMSIQKSPLTLNTLRGVKKTGLTVNQMKKNHLIFKLLLMA